MHSSHRFHRDGLRLFGPFWTERWGAVTETQCLRCLENRREYGQYVP